MRHCFIPITYAGREWDWQIPSYPISLPIKNENFTNWGGIPAFRRIPSLSGRDWDLFLSQKKYKDGIETFFHPICIYGMGLGLVNPIPSRPIANPSSQSKESSLSNHEQSLIQAAARNDKTEAQFWGKLMYSRVKHVGQSSQKPVKPFDFKTWESLGYCWDLIHSVSLYHFLWAFNHWELNKKPSDGSWKWI